MKYVAPLLVLSALLLGGCNKNDLPPMSIAPICKALIGPIHYNSKNPQSKRYAAVLLAMDLRERNRVGIELGCPKYKRKLSWR